MPTIKRAKDRQYNDHNIKDVVLSVLLPFYCGHCIVCPASFLLGSLYCLSFVLFIVVIALSVLRPFHCGHCIVCPSSFLLWSLYCLSFVLFIVVIALSVIRPFHCGHGIVCSSSFLLSMTTIKRTKNRQCNDHNKKDEGQTIQ
jgi:hypothetical protein